MTAPKLTPAQVTLAEKLSRLPVVDIFGNAINALQLIRLGLAVQLDQHHIRLQSGVTRVQHPSGTVWLNADGKVLAVE